MACPAINGKIKLHEENGKENNYNSYLKLQDLLVCTEPLTKSHDEHMFIVVHQVYELWFKQIIFEIDSLRCIFSQTPVDEKEMLTISSRLTRIVKIYEILVEQIKIVETITPLDFAEFRGALGTASGFQSWQFRLIENKLGVRNKKRIRYNDQKYSDVLQTDIRELVEKSETEPSLFDLINAWLERTPELEINDSNFWNEFINVCQQWFQDENEKVECETDPDTQKLLMESYHKTKETFSEIFTKENYDSLVARGDRALSWEAFKGALNIFYNREETIFHIPFNILSLLMDLDSLITKWRSAHVLLVQRQIGSKVGTGGSSGYLYLRSTVSDRYRPFLDLFQISNYLIPSKYMKGIWVKQSPRGKSFM